MARRLAAGTARLAACGDMTLWGDAGGCGLQARPERNPERPRRHQEQRSRSASGPATHHRRSCGPRTLVGAHGAACRVGVACVGSDPIELFLPCNTCHVFQFACVYFYVNVSISAWMVVFDRDMVNSDNLRHAHGLYTLNYVHRTREISCNQLAIRGPYLAWRSTKRCPSAVPRPPAGPRGR